MLTYFGYIVMAECKTKCSLGYAVWQYTGHTQNRKFVKVRCLVARLHYANKNDITILQVF